MRDTLQHSLRPVVQEYVRACEALVNGRRGSYDDFMTASDKLIHRSDDPLNEDERDQVQQMLNHLSVYLVLAQHNLASEAMSENPTVDQKATVELTGQGGFIVTGL
jgi:hypothetical protein